MILYAQNQNNPLVHLFVGRDHETFDSVKRDGSSPESSSELDSGISVNVNYEDPTRWNKRGESNRGSASPDEEKGKKEE